MNSLVLKVSSVFDFLYQYWEGPKNQKRIGSILVVVYLIALMLIFLNVTTPLFRNLGIEITSNIFFAIELAFLFLLFVEIISLVFVLSKSVTSSLIKQFEILSLILLRESFKEFGTFSGTFDWTNFSDPIYLMFSDAFGALLIFLTIAIISRLKSTSRITRTEEEQYSFINLKKGIALLLLLVFIVLGFIETGRYIMYGYPSLFFSHFYTILIFSDILIVLISMRYNYSYVILFRNSGFALATVLIRLALSSPPYINVLLGLSAGLFTLGLVAIYSRLCKEH